MVENSKLNFRCDLVIDMTKQKMGSISFSGALLNQCIILGCLIFTAQVLAETQSEEVNMDEVKIKLLPKGEFKGKKIAGPNKLLLQLKIAKDLKRVKVTPDTVNVENLDLLELNDPSPIMVLVPVDPLATTIGPK